MQACTTKNFETAKHEYGICSIWPKASGILLKDILKIIVPKGWFLKVTPGSKYITLGGAIASDVHGKNHHIDGCFSESVLSFNLMLSNGRVENCKKRDELFLASCGGMGLTGVILDAKISLMKI